ncbi:MAG: hypothetical protein CVU77_06240 [Elusimicrobia bacterium HGW-Elusimicrobia-1]|jgi:hypothetical protein|nr:MAG: hypothetical protein CVU77_06240 [Elusimicrobia bacterium HGW-Elusimicrobia-1]
MNITEKIKSIFDKIIPTAPEESDKDYWVYLAGNVVLTLFFINIFFWLLWTLIVYKGGIFIKIIPALRALFTSKTIADFGYEGYPFEMGVFDGWPENIVALAFTLIFIELCRRVYLKTLRRDSAPAGKDSNG